MWKVERLSPPPLSLVAFFFGSGGDGVGVGGVGGGRERALALRTRFSPFLFSALSALSTRWGRREGRYEGVGCGALGRRAERAPRCSCRGERRLRTSGFKNGCSLSFSAFRFSARGMKTMAFVDVCMYVCVLVSALKEHASPQGQVAASWSRQKKLDRATRAAELLNRRRRRPSTPQHKTTAPRRPRSKTRQPGPLLFYSRQPAAVPNDPTRARHSK